jgi:nucleolar MIF4G domain-containing protein 1
LDDPAAAADDGAAAAAGAAHLLKLAAGMKMNTDARRAVFVAIMGSEDCAEACEKLLRLPFKVSACYIECERQGKCVCLKCERQGKCVCLKHLFIVTFSMSL